MLQRRSLNRNVIKVHYDGSECLIPISSILFLHRKARIVYVNHLFDALITDETFEEVTDMLMESSFE